MFDQVLKFKAILNENLGQLSCCRLVHEANAIAVSTGDHSRTIVWDIIIILIVF